MANLMVELVELCLFFKDCLSFASFMGLLLSNNNSNKNKNNESDIIKCC